MLNNILIIEAILEFVLLFILLYRKSDSLKNRVFLFYVLGIIGWVFGIAMFRMSGSVKLAKIWGIEYYIAAALIATSLLQFSFLFPYRHKSFGKLKFFLTTAPFILFVFLIPTKYFIKRVIVGNPNIIDLGSLYHLYSLWFIFYFVILFINYFSNLRRSQGTSRLQLRYLLIGTLMSGIIGVSFNLILPWIGNYNLIQIGPAFSIIWLIFIIYAIFRHQLLDVRVLVLRAVAFSIVVLLFSASIIGLAILLPQSLGVSLAAKGLIAIGVSIFIVLILDPLKRFIANVTDNLFYKKRIDYQKLLSDLSNIINREIDLNKLTTLIEDKLTRDLKISRTVVYVAPTKRGDFVVRGEGVHQAYSIRRTSPLMRYLVASKRVVVLEALERKIEDTTDEQARADLEGSKEQLDQLDASLVSPVFVEKDVNAVLVLGHKLSGDPFGDEDINLLELLGPQLASAIVKSQLYDQIKQFNVQLQKEIDIATHDLQSTNSQLQERNRFLSAIQKVTTLMTRSLDLKRVTQDIVDSIATEMGFIGGILLFLGKDRRKLFPEAITKSARTDKIIKFLPKPISELWGRFDKDNTRSIRSIKAGKVEIGEKLAEFISPPVPADAANAIQRTLGVKTVIAVPIQSEGEMVGAIDYVLDADPGELKETDLQIMKALANQTGIVYKNIELYREIEESNKELAEANEHLKELDQAKSEFVSIASHQLRTPMTGIMGYLSMLVGGDFGKVKKDQLGIMQSLLEESKRMIRLIRIFLDVSKIESGNLVLKKAPASIEDIIVKSVDVLKKAAEDKKLKLVFEKIKGPLPKVPFDSDKISDVVMNLIDNAIKYTDKGSVSVSAKVEGDNLHVRIKDTGIGIEPKEAKGLFNKFVRGYGIAQINPDGSGLGLYVARRLTEAHGGKIWVESLGKGKGSTFQFILPLNPPIEKVVETPVDEHMEFVRKNR